jgi:hypothetical protein
MARTKPSYSRRRAKREARRRARRPQRLEQRRRTAQVALSDLEALFEELVLSSGLEAAVRKKLGAQAQMLGQLFAMMLPAAFGARSYHQLSRILGWSKNRPGAVLGALPSSGWQRKLRRLGRQIVNPVLRRTRAMSAASRSRWQMTLVVDSSVFRKFADHVLGLAGQAYSGQFGTTVRGLDVVLLIAVFGDGKLVVPLDFAIHRPSSDGPGRPGYSKLEWTEAMLQRAVGELELTEPPKLATDSWFGSSALVRHIEQSWQGLMLWQGKGSWVFYLEDGRKIQGRQLYEAPGLAWRFHPEAAGLLYARLWARSPSFGRVLLTLVRPPLEKRFYLLCPPTRLPSTVLIDLNGRRHWVEWCFRTLKHLLGAGLCQVRSERAYYGHLVVRLMGLTLLMLARARRLAGGATMEEMLFCIREHYQTLNSKFLNLTEVSPTVLLKRA